MELSSASGDTLPARPRTQWSLSNVFLLVLLLSASLALTTQLRHIGFVAACFLCGAGLSWLFRWPRGVFASTTALIAFVVTYAAAWMQLAYVDHMNYQSHRDTYLQLAHMEVALEQFQILHGRYPDDLSQMLIDDIETTMPYGYGVDGWNQPLQYEKYANGYTLSSFGRDGAPGGNGLDADLFPGQQQNLRLPLRQFLFETQGSLSVFWVATVTSLISGSLWLADKPRPVTSPVRMVASITFTVIAAAIVAVYLAGVHVALFQSGSGH